MTIDQVLGFYALADIVSVVFIAVYLMRLGNRKRLKSLPVLSIVTLLIMPVCLLIFVIYFILEKVTGWLIGTFYQEQLAHLLVMCFLLVVVLFSVIVTSELGE